MRSQTSSARWSRAQLWVVLQLLLSTTGVQGQVWSCTSLQTAADPALASCMLGSLPYFFLHKSLDLQVYLWVHFRRGYIVCHLGSTQFLERNVLCISAAFRSRKRKQLALLERSFGVFFQTRVLMPTFIYPFSSASE